MRRRRSTRYCRRRHYAPSHATSRVPVRQLAVSAQCARRRRGLAQPGLCDGAWRTALLDRIAPAGAGTKRIGRRVFRWSGGRCDRCCVECPLAGTRVRRPPLRRCRWCRRLLRLRRPAPVRPVGERCAARRDAGRLPLRGLRRRRRWANDLRGARGPQCAGRTDQCGRRTRYQRAVGWTSAVRPLGLRGLSAAEHGRAHRLHRLESSGHALGRDRAIRREARCRPTGRSADRCRRSGLPSRIGHRAGVGRGWHALLSFGPQRPLESVPME